MNLDTPTLKVKKTFRI